MSLTHPAQGRGEDGHESSTQVLQCAVDCMLLIDSATRGWRTTPSLGDSASHPCSHRPLRGTNRCGMPIGHTTGNLNMNSKWQACSSTSLHVATKS